MTALVQERSRRIETWKYKAFTLTGVKAYKGGEIFIIPSGASAGKVTNVPGDGYVYLGQAAETVDATSTDAAIQVDLLREITIERFVNATAGDACASTDVGQMAYAIDDQTVSSVPGAGRARLGRIWDVDTTKGVAVEKLHDARGTEAVPAVADFTANDWAPASLVNGAVYQVPATGAASTITLPASAKDGTVVYFAADGTNNSSTVQYRDATGPTNLTTALTAAKRHLVVAAKVNGKWVANAYVSP